MKKLFLFFLVAIAVISFNSCKKSTDDFQATPLSDYFPLEIGKYVVYNLDSTVYTNFGTNLEIHNYQVKYEVDAAIVDNLGRPAFRIFRYIRTSPTGTWTPDHSFMAVNTGNTIEFIENNMRFLKLEQVIRDNFSWKGNSYIDTYSLNSDVKYLDDWDYIYENVGQPDQVGTFALDNTITVNQRDEVVGEPTIDTAYSEINQSQEKYAKGIGMVYRNFFHSEYQPPVPGLGGHFVDGSFGVTLTMIDHN